MPADGPIRVIADDRERAVIKHLEHSVNLSVERLTVGDYAYVNPHTEQVLWVIERKTLNDLASSIKDGRMENNQKLLDAQNKTGCGILYIIEGGAYPRMDRKFSGIQFKCLQGKLDSLMLLHNIPIVWTKDEKHTAARIASMARTVSAHGIKTRTECDFSRHETFSALAVVQGEVHTIFDNVSSNQGGGQTRMEIPAANEILKCKQAVPVDAVQVKMLSTLPGVSFLTAKCTLARYTIQEVLGGGMDKEALCNLTYESNYRFGEKGARLWKTCQNLYSASHKQQCAKMLACIQGITIQCASLILEHVDMMKVVSLDFEEGVIASIHRTNTRKIGRAIEGKIRTMFMSVNAEHRGSL